MPAHGVAQRAGAAPRLPRRPITGGPYNAAAYLTTPTPDGTGVVTHPDVVDFGAGNTWNGWRYWMAMTPFSGSNSAVENPCILVSSNGTSWQVPAGLTNPIDPQPSTGYNSDPDLVYGQDGVMYLIYRMTAASPPLPTGDVIYCRSSSDGITWTDETVILQTAGNACLSPTIFWDGTQYVMFSVNDNVSPTIVERRTASSVTGTWSAPSTVSITFPGARTPWHIDAIKSGTKTYLIINEGVSNGQGRNLSVATSTDGTTFTLSGLLMVPSVAGWDGTLIYRASGEIVGSNLQLWYSASGVADWHVGFTTIPTSALP